MSCPCCRTSRFALEMKLKDGYYECGCGYTVKLLDTIQD